MQAVVGFIDRLPFVTMVVAAIFLALAPFLPEPHLVEKFRWLMTGHSFKAIDVFDVFWHLWPIAIVAIKIARGSTTGGRGGVWRERSFFSIPSPKSTIAIRAAWS